VVAVPGGFRGGGENTFGLDGAVLLEEGAFDKVDADLRNTGGDLTLGLRTIPETVRLRTGVGTGDSLDLADKAGTGDFLGSGWEDGSRRCGDALILFSCCVIGFRIFCLDEASEVGVNDFALTHESEEPGFRIRQTTNLNYETFDTAADPTSRDRLGWFLQ
jgi:hypothetical protein